MKTAILKTTGADRTRFEVHSTPSRGHSSGVQKWYMKANHPVEATRWIQAIGKSIDWYKADNSTADTSEKRRRSGDSDASGLKASASLSSNRGSMSSVSLAKRGNKHHRPVSSVNMHGSEAETSSMMEPRTDHSENGASPVLNQSDADDEDARDDSSDADSTTTPPHQAGFELHGNSTAAQMELTTQLLNDLRLPPDTPQRTIDTRSALIESFAVAQGMLNEYIHMAREREQWWSKQLEQEHSRQAVWEESLATVVKEGETLEKELRARSRKRGSRFFDSSVSESAGMGTLRRRSFIIPLQLHEEEDALTPQPHQLKIQTQVIPQQPQQPPMLKGRSETQETVTPRTVQGMDESESADMDTDEEDEFFDAIESNNLPNLVVPESLMSPGVHEFSMPVDMTLPYTGYKVLRQRLNITDERPDTSLWAVLKNSIGKDLTKISFPVSFNEPTSMLQRMVCCLFCLLLRLTYFY